MKGPGLGLGVSLLVMELDKAMMSLGFNHSEVELQDMILDADENGRSPEVRGGCGKGGGAWRSPVSDGAKQRHDVARVQPFRGGTTGHDSRR